eukprot:8042-Heterococcus_DN1.PRE.5
MSIYCDSARCAVGARCSKFDKALCICLQARAPVHHVIALQYSTEHDASIQHREPKMCVCGTLRTADAAAATAAGVEHPSTVHATAVTYHMQRDTDNIAAHTARLHCLYKSSQYISRTIQTVTDVYLVNKSLLVQPDKSFSDSSAQLRLKCKFLTRPVC